ncbi:hypothetical protein EYF80_029396 [Liparis tanakae]|uniref:Uncharacterized protein n=1 Tax=Liparis tanakae TaxID=230148 RepID=A0A4Z2H3H5_9TELE|nr:hypothetical protein EYF80_029396 [Liparis tanakae]
MLALRQHQHVSTQSLWTCSLNEWNYVFGPQSPETLSSQPEYIGVSQFKVHRVQTFVLLESGLLSPDSGGRDNGRTVFLRLEQQLT